MSFSRTPLIPPNACETVSGRYVDVAEPDPSTICLSDIAWSLSRQARFAGHTVSDEVWNVAQHSVFVESLIRRAITGEENHQTTLLKDSLNNWLVARGFLKNEFMTVLKPDHNNQLFISALMHDSTEAYLVDLPSPVKRSEGLREPYMQLECKMWKVIQSAFAIRELTKLESEIITWGDLMALKIEAANLMPSRGRDWPGLPQINITDIGVFPKIQTWKESYNEFLSVYDYLTRA